MSKQWKRWGVAGAAVLLAGSGAMAATWRVGPEDDVQSVIDGAAVNDLIVFEAGTYNTSLTIDKTLRLKGGAPKAEVILDGSGLYDPIITLASGVTGVQISGLTFRFTDDGYDAIQADWDNPGLIVKSSCFKGITGAGIDAEGADIQIRSNIHRGSVAGTDVYGIDLYLRGSRYNQVLEQGLSIEGTGEVLGDRYRGVGIIAISAESDNNDFVAPETTVLSFTKIEVRGGAHGLIVEGDDVYIERLTAKGLTGHACGIQGDFGQVTLSNFTRCFVSINLQGYYTTAISNTIRGGTMGIRLDGQTEASGNKVIGTMIGIRASNENGGGLRVGGLGDGSDLVISANKLEEILGIGIAVESANYATISENSLNGIGGSSFAQMYGVVSGSFDFAGAITVGSGASVSVASNTIGDVDSGAGIALGELRDSSVTGNVVEATARSGIAIGVNDPFESYYEFFPIADRFYSRLNLEFITDPGDYYYYEYGGGCYALRGVANHSYYYYHPGNNSIYGNTVTNVGTRGDGGIHAASQYSSRIRYNTVNYSGATGILLEDSDYCVIGSNSVLASEADGIWVRSEAEYGGNTVEWNTVSNSGAEGIQNGAEYILGGLEYVEYCLSYTNDEYSNYYCESYGGEFVYVGGEGGQGTTIRYNTVTGSGIAPFANDGVVDLDFSFGNSPQPADWNDIPVRQY